ncbi:MAG: SUF system Fe-S cluster assembly protein [Hyphomicrobiaceae bacterium]
MDDTTVRRDALVSDTVDLPIAARSSAGVAAVASRLAPADAVRDVPAAVEVTRATPLGAEEIEQLTADIVAAVKTVYDPEIPADIYELGLIYRIDIDDDRNVAVEMTLTAPGCPVAGEMPIWVENAINAVPGVAGTKVTLTFDPPWDQSRMSDEARLVLNMF